MQKALTKLIAILGVTLLVGCQNQEKTITVGASSTPHAEILEQAKPYLKSKGYDLKIKVFNDYVLPNYALENGELDANYFQHEPYLNEFNASNGTHLVSVYKVHFEPMGIYKGTKSSLESLVSSDKVIVPSDKSNYDRAVALLTEYSLENLNIVPVEAQNIPLMLNDCAVAVINGNYALSAGVTDRCLVTEDKTSEIAQRMANIIAVRSGKEESAKTKVLIESLSQDNIRDFITSKYSGSVIAMF